MQQQRLAGIDPAAGVSSSTGYLSPTELPDLLLSDHESSSVDDFLAFIGALPGPEDASSAQDATREGSKGDVSLGTFEDAAGPRQAPAICRPKAKPRRQQPERLRLKDQRKYQRKLARVQDLQLQVAELQQVLATSEQSKGARASVSVDTEAKELTERQRAEQMLLEVSQRKNELMAENAQLRKHFHQATAHSDQLREMLHAEHKLYLANASYFIMIKPLTPPDCQKELRRSMEAITAFYGVANTLTRTRAICGWDEKRMTEGARFHNFRVKTLHLKLARTAFKQTWQMFISPLWTEKMFSPVMGMRIRLVQHVDDDNFLFCYDYSASQILPQKSDTPVATIMALVTKFSTSSGHYIVTRGLQRGCVEVQDRLQSPAAASNRGAWLETLTW
ncbi:hypothetical protein BBJ28_00005443 [Nothophytophthora sp. Chile5]|nr:hypothetical protein BBJ28_00005443 [Nothophytophthora sp. Chile5]